MNAMTPPPADWTAEETEFDPLSQPQPRTFAGFKLTSIAIVAAFAVLIAWNIWETKKVIALEKRQLVSVSLQGLVTDFVMSESRRGGTPEETARKTKAYLDAVQTAVTNLGANGTPVLVSEAVVGHSIPDATSIVKAAVAKAMGIAASAPNAGQPAVVMPSIPAAPSAAMPMQAAPAPAAAIAAPEQATTAEQPTDASAGQGTFDGQR